MRSDIVGLSSNEKTIRDDTILNYMYIFPDLSRPGWLYSYKRFSSSKEGFIITALLCGYVIGYNYCTVYDTVELR